MASSGMLRRVRTDISEESSSFFIRLTRIGELGTTLETSVPTRATRRNIPENPVLDSHRRENLKSYILAGWLPTKARSMWYIS
jgi:hypothetical protein